VDDLDQEINEFLIKRIKENLLNGIPFKNKREGVNKFSIHEDLGKELGYKL
jgi:hypothetical protein